MESWVVKSFGVQSHLSFYQKAFIHNNDIAIKIDNKIIEGKYKLAKTFNLHYINPANIRLDEDVLKTS